MRTTPMVVAFAAGGANGGGATAPSVAGCMSEVGGGDLRNHQVTAPLEKANMAYADASVQAGAAVRGAQEQAGQAQQQADRLMKGLTPPKQP